MSSISRIEKYLLKSDEIKKWKVSGNVEGEYDLIVIIPALAEVENLFFTLESLAGNPKNELSSTLVLCVINNKKEGMDSSAIIKNNEETHNILTQLENSNPLDSMANVQLINIKNSGLQIAHIDASSPDLELPPKSGVGLARKIGLDHALNIVSQNGKGDRILVCLDADSLVEENYLSIIRAAFKKNKAAGGAISFSHRLPENQVQQRAIINYEIFLHYYVLALKYAKSPYAYHTVGSTMCCTADAYAAVNGMVRREAGEDYYFLQKLAKYGDIIEIDGTTVSPSSRSSWRVPFGTGKKMSELLKSDDLEIPLYNPKIFILLKKFLIILKEAIEARSSAQNILEQSKELSSTLHTFLTGKKFDSVWPNLLKNNPDERRLTKQFHNWFDAFATLKLVHYLRDNGYENCKMEDAVSRLLELINEVGGMGLEDDMKRISDLTHHFRH